MLTLTQILDLQTRLYSSSCRNAGLQPILSGLLESAVLACLDQRTYLNIRDDRDVRSPPVLRDYEARVTGV